MKCLFTLCVHTHTHTHTVDVLESQVGEVNHTLQQMRVVAVDKERTQGKWASEHCIWWCIQIYFFGKIYSKNDCSETAAVFC